MKDQPSKIKLWLLPENDKKVDSEIDMLNIKTIFFISLASGIVQLTSLVLFLLTKSGEIHDPHKLSSVIYVSLSVVLCIIGFIGAGYFRSKKDLAQRHSSVTVFVAVYVVLLVVWGMLASRNTFIRGEQIITFFTVELIVVIFVRLRPLFTVILVISTYTVFYLALNIWIKPGMINPYNYFMMGAISVVGALIVYRTTVNYIEQKNKAKELNESLAIVASHDSVTNLLNRYALNRHIPDYIDTDLCIAMVDIDRFKKINDTYGHRTGDDALKAFSDLLLRFFDHDDVYRYGGDEFLVVCRSRDLAAFRDKLTDMSVSFGEISVPGVKESLRCCFGCASDRPANPADFFDLVVQADQKLYEEKNRIKAER